MIYKDVSELNVLQSTDEDTLCFEDIETLLRKKPSNIIYLEKNGKLDAIISMGDIFRARKQHKNAVKKNRSFKFLNSKSDICARRIFVAHSNINEIPVIDVNNKLKGAYTRWNDYTFMPVYKNMCKLNCVDRFFRGGVSRIAFVEPVDKIKKSKFGQVLENIASGKFSNKIDVIKISDLPKTFDNSDYVVFYDEDEMRGVGTLFNEILNVRFDWRLAKTCRSLIEQINEYNDHIIGIKTFSELLNELNRSDINVFLLNCFDNGSEYYKSIVKEIETKCKMAGRDKLSHYLAPEWYKDFFGELYTNEYAQEISHHFFSTEVKHGVRVLKDYESKCFNVVNNERVTVEQPNTPTRRIIFVGPCLIVGHLVEDSNTIESFLQKVINCNGYLAKVINLGSFSTPLEDAYRVSKLKLNSGDIIIAYIYNPESIRLETDILGVNIVDILEKNNVSSCCFDDLLVHGNHYVNKLYANELFRIIEGKLAETRDGIPIADDKAERIITKAYCQKYFKDRINQLSSYSKNRKIGSIVMNCNPFTKGHRYLIEYALSVVDELIIFVVEEDDSLFSFEERYAMVIDGTEDLENITVVPSGWCILSKQTFPEYFLKVEDKEIEQNTEYDIKLFAQYIAPILNISYRFVGQEPFDPVTREYNKAMSRILGEYGIQYVEVPRIMNASQIISATKVRELIENAKYEEVKEYIPRSTYKYLGVEII